MNLIEVFTWAFSRSFMTPTGKICDFCVSWQRMTQLHSWIIIEERRVYLRWNSSEVREPILRCVNVCEHFPDLTDCIPAVSLYHHSIKTCQLGFEPVRSDYPGSVSCSRSQLLIYQLSDWIVHRPQPSLCFLLLQRSSRLRYKWVRSARGISPLVFAYGAEIVRFCMCVGKAWPTVSTTERTLCTYL